MNIEDFKQLKSKIKDDVTLTEDNIIKKSQDIPIIYCRYLGVFATESKKLKTLKANLQNLYAKKYNEYKFKKDYALSSKEVDIYIHGDDTYDEKLKEYNWQVIVVNYLSEQLENIKRMTFTISNIIKMKEFLAGK